MPRPKQNAESIRSLHLVGQKSMAVTIPKTIVEALGLMPGEKVSVRRDGQKIIIERVL